MKGKVVMVTGATAGLGWVTARVLAEKGAAVLVVGRNPQKTAAVVEQLKRQTGNPRVDYLLADLSVQKDIHHLADEFKSKYLRLDVLVNNAGAFIARRQESVDGYELTFALNHLSCFLLTNLLLDALKAGAPSRIVNVSSGAHVGATLNFGDLQNRRGYNGFRVYGQSKLANVLFTYELARRLERTGVTANVLHPGFVATNFATNNGFPYNPGIRLAHLFALGPQEGARTQIYLASSPEVEGVTGKYFMKEKEVSSSPASYDRAAGARLWQVSEEMTQRERIVGE